MSCPGIEALERYVDGALEELARREVDSHVSSCPSCRERVAEVQKHLDLAGRVVAADACPSGAATVIAGSAAAPGAHVGVGSDSGETSDAGATSDADATTVGEPRPAAAPRELPKDSLPGYSILKEISRGGQGVVYQAIQRSTSRKVAIKVLRDGHFADAGDRARFEREVQILGQLKHANIVSIYDSGSVGGHAFFVMDYVSGKALDEWAADLKSQISDLRLERPAGNPRATGGGTEPTLERPKAWGGARSPGGAAPPAGRRRQHAVRDAAAKAWLRRLLEVFAGVCDAVHAAHLRGIIHRDLKPSNIRIDADGQPRVLDFGLAKVAGAVAAGALAGRGAGEDPPVMTLTGQFLGSLPWSSPEQAEGQPSKIDIRTDVYSLGVILYQLLAGRFPYDVTGNMRDVLDRILRTEPPRPSATAWHGRPARDWLNDELDTIVLKCLAKERERRYQSAGELGRDIRHYLAGEAIEAKRDSGLYLVRKALARYRIAARVIAAFVVVVVAGGAVSTTLYLRAERQRAIAEEERRKALVREEQLRVVAGFQASMLERIDMTRTGEAMLHTIGDQVDSRMRAERHPPHVVERAVRAYDDAARWVNPADLAQAVLKSQLLAPALATIDKEFKNDPELEATLRHHVGGILGRLGFYEEGIEHSRRAVAIRRRILGNDHPDTLASVHALGAQLLLAGSVSEAEPLCREAAEKSTTVRGADDPRTLSALQTFGSLLTELTKLVEAEPYCRRALEGRRRVLGDQHPDTLASLVALGELMRMLERPGEAEVHFQAALAGRERVLGPEHPATLECLGVLGTLYRWTDRLDDAERAFARALDGCRHTLGEEHPETLGARADVATVLWLRGRFDAAEAMFRQNLEIARRLKVDQCSALDGLALVARSKGRLPEAEKLYRQSMELMTGLPPEHKWFALHNAGLGACVARQGRFAEAEPLLVEGCTALLAQPIAPHFRRQHLADIVYLYEAWDAAEPGKGYDQKAAEWRAKLEALNAASQPVRDRGASAAH